MKKMISMLLALTMVLCLAACGGNAAEPTEAPTEAAQKVEGTMEELLNKVIEIQPVEFMGGTVPIDITDTSEEGLWLLSGNTGLENADSITDAATFGPMMGSIAYCMSAVRVKEGADVAAVAQTMKTNIDPRKWVCVEATEKQAVVCGDLVMFVMLDPQYGVTCDQIVEAFTAVCGGTVGTILK